MTKKVRSTSKMSPKLSTQRTRTSVPFTGKISRVNLVKKEDTIEKINRISEQDVLNNCTLGTMKLG